MLRLFNHYFPFGAVMQVLIDSIAIFVAIIVAAMVLNPIASTSLPAVVVSALVFAVLMVVLSGAAGLYGASGESLKGVLARVTLIVVLSVPIATVVFKVLPDGALEGNSLSVIVSCLAGTILFVRGVSRMRSGSSIWSKRVLVIGTGREAAAVEFALTHPRHPGLEVVGFYPVPLNEPAQVGGAKVFDAERSLVDTVAEHKVDEIIVAVRERRGGCLSLSQLLDCKLAGVKVLDLSCFFERVRGQVRVDSLRASWLIYGDGFRQGFMRTSIKRLFDIVCASILLVLALPVMLLTAVAIWLEDGAPVLYRQERVGQGGRLFNVVKFRSMRKDAEKDGKPRWAASNDDRITRVGHFIRLTRIDELPQLFSVLVGHMSLVGPRPERPYFVEQLTKEIPFYAVRHSVKPGVTGWAQVRYQYGSSIDDAVQKLQYDLFYVKNHTLFLDLVVLVETVRVVLTGEGAK